MIVRTKHGWLVLSHDKTRRLGGPYKTKAEAEARLAQVERFKRTTRQRR